MKEAFNDENDIMSGDELKEKLLGWMKEAEDTEEGRGKTWVFQNTECKKKFKRDVKKSIVFVYRASPDVKHMLVCALRQSAAIVGVTGEGLGDARALSEANVGFTMGQDGCSAAKDHADVIMTDDNFFTVITAIKWGRNVQDNVRKFVQFQLTVNVVTMLFVISTCLILGHSPFNVVQLLWINLIMDVLAAIAFSTENPPTEIRRDRVSPKDRIITKPMMRSILFQSIYQLIVMIMLLYVAPKVGGYEYNLYKTQMTNPDGTVSYRCLHQTFMFHCFVMMNLFNMINCRVLDPIPAEQSPIEEMSIEEQNQLKEASKPSFNIFTRPFSNLWFWIIFFAELNIQYTMVGYVITGRFFNTTPMTTGMHFTALGLGLGSWAISALVKLSGDKVTNAMPQFGEDKEALEKAKGFADRAKKLQVKQKPAVEQEEQHSDAEE